MKTKFDQTKYIQSFNKKTYKLYQFRIRKDDKEIISFLDGKKDRNAFIKQLIENNKPGGVLTLKQIKQRALPVFKKYGIESVSLFGSYARGEAKASSDVDFYCGHGNVKSFGDQINLEKELVAVLDNKEVDVIYDSMSMSDFFRQQIMEDMIKLC